MADTTPVLHFSSGGREYLIRLTHVKEILRMVTLAPLPELPEFVRGVINVRGEVVPVIDFLMRAGATRTRDHLRNRIVLIRLREVLAGLLVDDVKETLTIEREQWSQNLTEDLVLDPKYIDGMVVTDGVPMVLVNIEKLLTDKDYRQLEKGLADAQRA